MSKELYEYVVKLKDYIMTLERRIESLEKQVNPPETVDLGNGRSTFTRHGLRNLLDRYSERDRQPQ